MPQPEKESRKNAKRKERTSQSSIDGLWKLAGGRPAGARAASKAAAGGKKKEKKKKNQKKR